MTKVELLVKGCHCAAAKEIQKKTPSNFADTAASRETMFYTKWKFSSHLSLADFNNSKETEPFLNVEQTQAQSALQYPNFIIS